MIKIIKYAPLLYRTLAPTRLYQCSTHERRTMAKVLMEDYLYRKIKHRTMYFNGTTTLYIDIRNIIIQEGIGTPIKTNDRLRRRRVDKRKITPRADGGRL